MASKTDTLTAHDQADHPVILIVEDEEDIAELIERSLQPLTETFGTAFVRTGSGEEALAIHKARAPLLVILDLQLPDLDGLSICSRIKKRDEELRRHTALVMLTARDSEKDIILGYDLGVDDYIIKPFSPNVLRARVQAILSKIVKRGEAFTGGDKRTRLTFGDIALDDEAKALFVGGKKIFVSSMEWNVLKLFAQHPEKVFSRSEIINAVRGKGYPITVRAVDVQIFSIRKKMQESREAVIATVRGMGYKLTRP